jgi:hypothetical protein
MLGCFHAYLLIALIELEVIPRVGNRTIGIYERSKKSWQLVSGE